MNTNATIKKAIGCAVAAYLMAGSLAEAITIQHGNNTITLGLSASGVGVTDNLDTTFTAPAGDAGGGLAKWNFDSFVGIVGGGKLGDYQIGLFYDFDPSASIDVGLLGLSAKYPNASLSVKSWNLGLPGLRIPTANPLFVDPPNINPFDPNAEGQYSFALVVKSFAGQELGRTTITVNTINERTSDVPEAGATLSLLAIGAGGLCGFGAFNRRKR